MTETNAQVKHVLLVYPHFLVNHFLNFEYMWPLYPGKKAVIPPLGLLIFAGCLPEQWEIRLIDENIQRISEEDLLWADMVATSGMHAQRERITEVIEMANKLNKITVLGGPSATICPEFYPQPDILHVGEIGDATDKMITYLATLVEKPSEQVVFRTEQKTPLEDQPLPRIDLINVHTYTLMPAQFSVGCVYKCEFCDIPVIYGKPRLKSPERVIQELQAIYNSGFVGEILFVDDNLIAHRKSLQSLLIEIIEWQKANNYPYPLTGEASVDLAEDTEILQLMHDARFTHLFLGVESPDEETLKAISKKHNTRRPLIESIRIIQSYGIELIVGIIFGFDNDTEKTGKQVEQFLKETCTPIVHVNLLAALPKTPLWERLETEGRLIEEEGNAASGFSTRSDAILSCLSTNIDYKLPNELINKMLLETIAAVYSPSEVYGRLTWSAKNVYGKQLQGIPPVDTWTQRRYVIGFTVGTLSRVIREIGLKSRYRRLFWRFVWTLVRLRLRGQIKSVLAVLLQATPNAHHIIQGGHQLLKEGEIYLLTPSTTGDSNLYSR